MSKRAKTSKANGKNNTSKPDRGIETMFRVSSSNHQRLSDMADKKAHILITVNAIILSAIISLLLRRLNEQPYLAVPTIILIMVSLTTMTFAILATRPNIPKGKFTPEQLKNGPVNLLFFGNFYNMQPEAYHEAMLKVMNDGELLYRNLIYDNYGQGIVLGKKYRQLRVAYNLFMVGLIVSTFAFLSAVLIHTQSIA
ncbi:hypothetical protein DYU05_06405 [Mucilaginibacter terrenus]|uniref:Pycsar effector protein domain-containing protein n=1 Tax=Mucilaginibacter terrenus TaxID=2482727 RepID=A0A3E2NW87_9SPHI|nr:Pycsar system effector family protein [Mucilaginibacter terrenus]RFZ85227.1 hypothetical protein DYU05_06405 [Mucilaginibacter terrenus]